MDREQNQQFLHDIFRKHDAKKWCQVKPEHNAVPSNVGCYHGTYAFVSNSGGIEYVGMNVRAVTSATVHDTPGMGTTYRGLGMLN